MAEPCFLTADVNDLNRTPDQLILVKQALKLSVAWELFDLAWHYADLSSILADRFYSDPVTRLAFDVVTLFFRQELAFEIIAVIVEVKKSFAAECRRLVFGVKIIRIDNFY